MNTKYIIRLKMIKELSYVEQCELEKVCEKFAFRSNEYYNSLINWDDPDDPIRRIVIPDNAELHNWGKLDASNEKRYTKVPGLEHKYEHTALLKDDSTQPASGLFTICPGITFDICTKAPSIQTRVSAGKHRRGSLIGGPESPSPPSCTSSESSLSIGSLPITGGAPILMSPPSQ